MMETSPLFLVPLEVRQIIYEYYLSFTRRRWLSPTLLRQMHFIHDKPHSTALPSLMLTCKRAYAELRSDVHSNVVLWSPSNDSLEIGFAVHGILRFERLRRLFLVIEWERPPWDEWLSFFGEAVSRMPALEHVTIDWSPPSILNDWPIYNIAYL